MGAIESNIGEDKHLAYGEDKTLQWTVTTAAGAAQAMTGWTVELNIMDRPGGTALITKAPGTFNDADGTDDQVEFALAAADWSAVPERRASLFYTVHRTDTGAITLLAFGRVPVHVPLPTA